MARSTAFSAFLRYLGGLLSAFLRILVTSFSARADSRSIRRRAFLVALGLAEDLFGGVDDRVGALAQLEDGVVGEVQTFGGEPWLLLSSPGRNVPTGGRVQTEARLTPPGRPPWRPRRGPGRCRRRRRRGSSRPGRGDPNAPMPTPCSARRSQNSPGPTPAGTGSKNTMLVSNRPLHGDADRLRARSPSAATARGRRPAGPRGARGRRGAAAAIIPAWRRAPPSLCFQPSLGDPVGWAGQHPAERRPEPW